MNDQKISTLRVLCEHAEKICAAVALRSLHIKYGHFDYCTNAMLFWSIDKLYFVL